MCSDPCCSQKGFTLLEILLVIVIISLTAAMVIPSFVNVNHGDVRDEGRRLQQVFRLVSEESQMTGMPIRWTARKHEYSFEMLNNSQEWMEILERPFSLYLLPSGVLVSEVKKSVSNETSFLPDEEEKKLEKNKEPVIGRIFFWPDGMLTASEVTLTYEDNQLNEFLRLQLRSGPGGIRIRQDELL